MQPIQIECFLNGKGAAVMDLEQFWGKRVRLIDNNGQSWKGIVNAVTSAADNDDTEPSITIRKPEEGLFTDGVVEILQSEIVSIEEVQS